MNNLEPKDLKQGMVFGRLTLIRREKESSSLNWVVQYSCEKKTIKVVRASNILRGATKGCGCLQIEGLKIGMEKAKHGNSRRSKKTKEYKVWEGMKKRCLTDNPKYAIYKNIEVCDRWKSSFQNFLDDMGAIPSNDHSIDRIDNSKGYFPENCRWATRNEQARNKTNNVILTYNGKTMTAPEWEEETGIPASNIRRRIRNGWSIEDTLTRPSTTSRSGVKHKKKL